MITQQLEYLAHYVPGVLPTLSFETLTTIFDRHHASSLRVLEENRPIGFLPY